MNRLPKFAVYKNSGAMQLNLQLPDLTVPHPKPGCVMMDICNSKGRRDENGNMIYNWDEKIIMKLDDRDIADILDGLRGNHVRLIHSPGGKTEGTKKLLEVSPGRDEGTVLLKITYGEKKAMVPLDRNEVTRIRLLLMAAIPMIYRWS